MKSQGELLLEGLQARLETIKTSNAYPLTIKSVIVNHNQININVDDMNCPLIEIVQGNETYEHKTNGMLHKWTDIGLRLVAAKSATDLYMEQFKSCVTRCIYCNGYDKQGNDGIRLASQVVMPRLTQTVPDYGVIDSNRIYVMIFEVETITQTWRF